MIPCSGQAVRLVLSCDSCKLQTIERRKPRLPYPMRTRLKPLGPPPQAQDHRLEEQAKAFKDESHNGLPLTHASKFYLYRATKGGETWDLGLILRSDHEPNEVKLRNLLGADALELVPLEEAEALAGCKSGFIGPVELKVPIYGDRILEGAFNLTCGRTGPTSTASGSLPSRTSPNSKLLRLAQTPKVTSAPLRKDISGIPRH